ncbi:MAG: hypothetical protein ABSB15_07930 [Bryobacteraceae bacterium]|jgi:hypothetical protein
MAAGLMLFVGVILLVFFLRRLLCWMDRRGWILYSGDPPTYGSLGNAFQQIQSLGEPRIQYCLDEKQAERCKDEGGPDDPVGHLPETAI